MPEKMSAEELERVRLWLECEWDASVDGVKEAMAAQEATGRLIDYARALQHEADGMREALLAAHHAIVSLDEDVFGPILDGHGGHCGWVRDELLSNLRAALNPPQEADSGDNKP